MFMAVCGAKIAVRRQTKCVGFDGNAKKNDNRGVKNRKGDTLITRVSPLHSLRITFRKNKNLPTIQSPEYIPDVVSNSDYLPWDAPGLWPQTAIVHNNFP